MSDLTPLGEAEVEEVYAVPLDEIREWVKRFMDARQRRREAAEEEDEAKEMIRSILEAEDAEFGTISGKIVLRNRVMTVRRFNKKKFARKYPDLVEQFTEPNEERRMEVVEDDE